MAEFFKACPTLDLDEIVIGDRPNALPVFECPECRSYSGSYTGYPGVNPKEIFDAKTLRLMVPDKEPKGYGLEQYQKHSAQMRKVVGEDQLIAPGTSFGRFAGKVRKQPPHFQFQMHHGHIFLAQETVVDQLNGIGFGLKSFEADLKSNRPVPKLVEILPQVVGEATNMRLCPHCNRSPDKISHTVKANSIPSDAHFVRLRNWPNYLVMTKALVDKIKELGLTGLRFYELKTDSTL